MDVHPEFISFRFAFNTGQALEADPLYCHRSQRNVAYASLATLLMADVFFFTFM